MDMSESIKPKSDQLNADDLLTGAQVFTVTEVTKGNLEQPFHFHLEGNDGRPWKPCKSMRRVIVKGWGADTKLYAGRSFRLFCDPSVKWGGQEVGGIRIAAMSHIDQPLTMNLTSTRGKRAVYRVEVLQQPTKGEEDNLAAWRAKFDSCKSLEDLRALWVVLPKDDQQKLAALKDKAKTRIEGEQG